MGPGPSQQIHVSALRAAHLDAAASLVAGSYRSLRSQQPSLPERYEDPATIGRMLDGLGEPSGVVAEASGILVGFITGFVLDNLLGKRSYYSPEWANGAEPQISRLVYEEMYREASPLWLAAGCAAHAVSLMTHDQEGREAWQWQGFGLVSADGVRDLAPVEGGCPGLEIRVARTGDAAPLRALGLALEQHMAAPPVLWVHDKEDYAGWLELRDRKAWLAWEGAEAVGCLALLLGQASGCAIVQDEATVGINLAYVRPEARARGVTTALLREAVAWARDHGYARCAVDWETMNIQANRFWSRRFAPVCYSLLRCVDERLLPGR